MRPDEGEDILRLIASRIRLARKQAGLSQGVLGKSLGVTDVAISDIERAVSQVNIPTLERIATLLGKPLTWFFEHEAGEGSLPPPAVSKPPSVIIAELQELAKIYVPVYDRIDRGPYMVPVYFLPVTTQGLDLKHVKGYRIKGLECEPGIKDGDTLIVDSAARPEPGDYVLVRRQGKPDIGVYAGGTDGKAVISNPENSWRLESCRVIGIVVELHRYTRKK